MRWEDGSAIMTCQSEAHAHELISLTISNISMTFARCGHLLC